MDKGRKQRWLRAPSPAMVVALVALIFAMSGTAIAATHLVSGDKLIKKQSLSGNRLRAHTVTGTQINLAMLGKVPSAVQADTATTATTAGSAAPSGAAGGDLGGSYPKPTIANGAVGTSKLGAIPGARVRNSAAIAVPSGYPTTTLTYNIEDFDVGNLHSTTTATSRLTAPVAGKYLIMASAAWLSSSNGVRALALWLNGTTEIGYDQASPNFSGNGEPQQTVETVYQLAAGDYVEVQAFQNSLALLYIQKYDVVSPVFSMDWIAP